MGKYSLERMFYPSDVTDEEWAILEPLIPGEKPGGRPQEIERREIVNGILYVLRSACPWRMMPHDAAQLEYGVPVFSGVETGRYLGTGQCCTATGPARQRCRVILNRVPQSLTVNRSKQVPCGAISVGMMGGEKNPRQRTASAGGHPRAADVGQSARSFLG